MRGGQQFLDVGGAGEPPYRSAVEGGLRPIADNGTPGTPIVGRRRGVRVGTTRRCCDPIAGHRWLFSENVAAGVTGTRAQILAVTDSAPRGGGL